MACTPIIKSVQPIFEYYYYYFLTFDDSKYNMKARRYLFNFSELCVLKREKSNLYVLLV